MAKICCWIRLPFMLFAPVPLFFTPLTSGIVISENFSGDTTDNKWLLPLTGGGVKPNVACLTAGNGVNSGSATAAGVPPKCTVDRDAVGSGALRLTSAGGYQAGGILSDFTFPTNEGIDVTFVTYTYGGSGADGINFFLSDGDEEPSIGAQGGSLGYSCANKELKVKAL